MLRTLRNAVTDVAGVYTRHGTSTSIKARTGVVVTPRFIFVSHAIVHVIAAHVHWQAYHWTAWTPEVTFGAGCVDVVAELLNPDHPVIFKPDNS